MEKYEENQALLVDESSDSLKLAKAPTRILKTKLVRIYLVLLHMLVVLQLSSTAYLYWQVRGLDINQDRSQIYSPANDIIDYETVVFYDNVFEISPYQGAATDEKDRLWTELYRDTRNTLITAEEASNLPNQTVVLSETGGTEAVVSLEVFHQLHCLDALRQSLEPERYPQSAVRFPNGTRNAERTRHHEHCIDRIRQGLQCASDVGTIYWEWKGGLGQWQMNMETTHTCRNFEKIRQWAVAREFKEWNTTAPPI